MARSRRGTFVSVQCVVLVVLVLAALGNVWYLSSSSGCTSALQEKDGVINDLETIVDGLKGEIAARRAEPKSVPQLQAEDLWGVDDAKPSPAVRDPPKPSIRGAIATAPAAEAVDMSAFTVLVICYNRPEYLTRTLGSIGAAWPSQGKGPRVLVSQDGTHSGVAGVARTGADTIKASWPAGTSGNLQFSHVQHTQSRHPGDDVSGYAALARHFGWAITRAFQSAPTQYVIIVEDDLELAGDFFSYFAAVAPLLDADSTLLAASAYNDIGQAEFVGDPGRVVRSDFFPGLGWMLTRSRWGELGPKWPGGYWDDWLREPAQRQGRNILRPEVSRSRTFGEKGVSRAQFFHKYLGNIHLNTAPAQWGSADLSYLDKAQWDSDLAAVVGGASKSASVAALAQQSCGPSPDLAAPVVFPGEHGWLAPSTMQAAGGLGAAAFKVEYSGFTGAGGYERLAQTIGFIGDVKARVPRTAYRGVVAFRHKGCLKLLVPSGWTPGFESK